MSRPCAERLPHCPETGSDGRGAATMTRMGEPSTGKKPTGMTLRELLAADERSGAVPAQDDVTEGDHETATAVAGITVTGLQLDSRRVEPGDLYLALRGAQTHGLHFAANAIDRGAVAVAIDADDSSSMDAAMLATLEALRAQGFPVVDVPALASRSASLATRLHGHPDRLLTLVAVTGTDGKTSVCRFIADALERLGTPCGYIGTLGWGRGDDLSATQLTTPDAPALIGMLAALRDRGAVAVALEASSHGLATGRLDRLDLDVAVLTNLGRDHLDFHGDEASYRRAKARLFAWPSLSSVVLNGDDGFGRELADELAENRPELAQFVYRLAAGTPAPVDTTIGRADAATRRTGILAADVQPTSRGLSFTLIDDGVHHRLESPLVGRFNVDNLLACHGVLRALDVASTEAANVLVTLKPVPGRMERFTADERPTVVVDYAHTPQALVAALGAAREHCKGELWVVFGCGGDRDRGKRAPMGRAAERADRIVVTDDNPRSEASADIIAEVLAGMRDPALATVIADRASAIAHAVAAARAEDVVLIAGKGHEDYQIVGDQHLLLSDRHCVTALLAEAS